MDVIAVALTQKNSRQIEELQNSGVDTLARTQLIDVKQQLNGFYTTSTEPKRAYFTLMDDDGRSEFLTKIKPVLDANNVKMSLAINAGYVGTSGYMTWEQIEQLNAEGFEILNHGYYHQIPATLTLEQLQQNYELEKAAFIAHGLENYDYFVYPGVQVVGDTETKEKLKKVYKCCFANANSPDNNIPFDNYEVCRRGITSGSVATNTINTAIANNGYCVLFGHSYMSVYTPEDLQNTITILLNLNVTFNTAKFMIDNFKNIIEIGNAGSGDHIFVGPNGKIDFAINGINVLDIFKTGNYGTNYLTTEFSNAPITEYVKNCITIENVTYVNASGFKNSSFYALPDAGTIITYRGESDLYAFQKYVRAQRNEEYIRFWNNSLGKWGKFTPTAGVWCATVDRPLYAKKGTTVLDTTLSKPIWCSSDGVSMSTNPAWQANSPYAKNANIVNAGYVYRVITAGTSGATAPVWTTEEDSIITDNSITWICLGAKNYWKDATGTAV